MTKTTTSLSAAFALTLTLGLGACASEEPVEPATSPAATATQDDTTAGEATEDATDDATEDATVGAADDADETTDGAAADDADETATGPAAVPPPADGEDLTASALRAIDAAEAETGGTAYEIDDQDSDGSWEIDVRVDYRSVEVTVAEDGTVLGTDDDDDLDSDDRAALDTATITLQEAIELAIAEVGGVLDDAELEEDNGSYYWEVSVDDTDRGGDVEVKVSVTGEIIEIDD